LEYRREYKDENPISKRAKVTNRNASISNLSHINWASYAGYDLREKMK